MTGDDRDDSQDDPREGERIAKALARAGVGSRRDVERMIAEGCVTLDGQVLTTPAVLITSLEGVRVNGAPVTQAEEPKIWRFHKPRGVLTTQKDPQGRPTVFEKLPAHLGRVISVGRLDMNTEGLLLLTNDGELARYLELPSHDFVRRYRVRVYGTVDPKKLARLIDGATINGVHYGPVEASIESSEAGKAGSQKAANTWLNVAIREGKNREVRRLMEHLDLHVNRLIRTHFGPFVLGPLALGAVDRVGDAKLRSALAGFFKERPETAAIPTEARANPKKWARAKPKHDKGVKRRKSARQREREAEQQTAVEQKVDRDPQKPAQGGQRLAQKPGQRSGAKGGHYSGQQSGKNSGKTTGEKSDKRPDQKQGNNAAPARPSRKPDAARQRRRPPGRGPISRGNGRMGGKPERSDR